MQEERANRVANGEQPAGQTFLALGDPVFSRLEDPTLAQPEPPDHGVLITMAAAGSNAARSGIKSGDVLLSYAGSKLSGAADLTPAIEKATKQFAALGADKPDPEDASRQPTEKRPQIELEIWRDGETLRRIVQPGKLGVVLSKKPATEAVLAEREADKLIRASRGGSYPPLAGTRREVEALARLFQEPQILLGSNASEQNLQALAAAGRLRQFRFLHLATHGEMKDDLPMQSALILAQDNSLDAVEQYLAGKEVFDGRLTAEQILETWHLDADLVVLSACESGLGKQAGGEGYLGFSQALFLAGARSLVLSLWKVDDTATALLMTRFYQNLLGKREGLDRQMPKAQALREAKHWLHNLKAPEVDNLVASLPDGERGIVRERKPAAAPQAAKPYEHPYYWAAFILIGDSN
jgi:hypothetical protein